LYEEAVTPVQDNKGEYGIMAIYHFVEDLQSDLEAESELRFKRLREASLILRAELSNRVYLCALLRAASGWISDPHLREIAQTYFIALKFMETARDVLIKTLAHPRPEYDHFIVDCMRHSLAAEEQLAQELSMYVM
jgi:hypothetical protein